MEVRGIQPRFTKTTVLCIGVDMIWKEYEECMDNIWRVLEMGVAIGRGMESVRRNRVRVWVRIYRVWIECGGWEPELTFRRF